MSNELHLLLPSTSSTRLLSTHNKASPLQVLHCASRWKIAKARDLPIVVIATAWCLSKGVNPIVGFDGIERIDESVSAVKVLLSKEEIEALEAAQVPKAVTGY